MKKFMTVMLVWLCFLTQGLAYGESITGQVIDVADGDTLTIVTSKNETLKIRLAGIDCPETFQVHGETAKQFLSSNTLKRRARIEPETIDQYDRTVGMVLVNGENINELTVAQGHCWVFRKYCKADYCRDWLKLEETARNSRVGLWEDSNPMPPWEWRAVQKSMNAGESSSVCAGAVAATPAVAAGGASIVYHGNRRSQVFHGPGCKDYNCKNCTVTLGSVQEAVGAGYRPHRECVQ